MRVIRSGLAAQDRVIISGVQRARAGRKVNAQVGQISAFPSGVSRGEDGRLDMPSSPDSAPTVPTAPAAPTAASDARGSST
jgi:hypothetical protein